MITLPQTFKKLAYRLNADAGRYLVEACPVGFMRMPPELVVEERRAQHISADLVIRSTDPEPHRFFTGLRQLGDGQLFYGNHRTLYRGKQTRNFTVFRFAADSQSFRAVYFPGFYPRMDIGTFIRELVGRGIV